MRKKLNTTNNKMLNRRDYFYKLLITYALIFFTAISISSLFIYRFLRDNMEREVYDKIIYTTQSILSYINRSIVEEPNQFILDKFLSNNSYNNLPAFFYLDEKPSDVEVYNLQRKLKSSMYNYEYIKGVYVYSIHQDMLMSAHEGYIDGLFSQKRDAQNPVLYDLTASVIRDDVGDSEYFYHADSQRLFMVNILPLYSSKTKCVGYVFTEINIDLLLGNVNRQYGLNDYSIIISDSDYSGIFASKLTSNVYLDVPYKDSISNEILGIKTVAIHGSTHIISWGKTSGGEIMLTLAIPYSSISEKAMSLSRTVLLTTFSVMLVLLTVVFLVTKYLYRPIKNIIGTASRLYKTQSSINDIDFINQSFIHLSSQVETMKKTLYENRHIIEYRLMLDLIQNRVKNPSEVVKKLETLNRRLDLNQLFIVITKFEPSKDNDNDMQLYEYTLIKIRDAIEDSFPGNVLFNTVYSADCIITLFTCKDSDEIADIAEDLFDLVCKETDLKFNTAFSQAYTNILDTYRFFVATERYLYYSFILGYQNIFYQEKIQKYELNDYVLSADDIKFIEAKIRTGRIDELKAKIRNIAADMKSNYSITSIQSSLLTMINTICVTLSEMNVIFSGEQKEKIRSLFENIGYIDDCIEFVFNMLDDCNEILRNHNSAYVSNLSQKLFKYIDENIQNELSLASIADHFKLSQGYLSRLFKESTGYGFSEYIISKKLEKAAHYLKSQSFSVKDIAESLGYFKLSYFSKIFKEKYGVTPSQYRKNYVKQS